MKIKIILLPGILTFIFGSQLLMSQENPVIIGANVVFDLPVGTLGDHFKGAAGGMIYAGKQISESWTWVGKFEYFELSDLNSSKLYKTIELQNNGTQQKYKFPLTKLRMKLKAAGLTAEARLNIIRSSLIETNLTLGFGFYYWENNRQPYSDSLFADTSGTGQKILLNALVVPGNTQTDWSGGVNLGFDFSIKIIEPVWINIGADYKLIVGEIWPALALDLENVSGMQFFSFRAGLKINL